MQPAGNILKHYFIPHEGNEHKPHILRARSVGFVLLIAIVLQTTFLYGSAVLAPRSRLFGIILTNALVDGTNENRAANNVPELTVSPLLNVAAQDKANDMVANNYFAHTSPSGLTPWYWFEQVGYNFTYAGENLAVNFSDSQDVTTAWMNSPEHRANILNPNFTQIGMATAQGTYNGQPAVYVVELFGTPAPAAPSAEPIAFVNTASAANNPSATVPAVIKTKPKPVATASNKTPAKTPLKILAPGVTVIPTSGSQNATSNQTFVAVQGASISASGTEAGAVGGMSFATQTASTAPTLSPSAIVHITPQPQSSFIQSLAANPRQVVDDIYLAIMALFALALSINVFVKIRIQHPQVIFGGMIVILIVGLLIVMNQHALISSAIL